MSKKEDVDYEARAKRMVDRIGGERASEKIREDVAASRRNKDLGSDSTSLSNRASHRMENIKGHLQYVEKRTIPVAATCDVLVVGGGPAGLSAAVGAARAGVDTMIVERYGCFGGTITTVGMETLGWYRYEGTVEGNGIGMEMERRAAALDKDATEKFAFNESECLDADYFKLVADHLVRDNKIRPLLHTYVVESIVEDGKIVGVVTESKSGRQVIQAKCVIDCTGDADVAWRAGAECRMNAVKDRMGVTTIFSAAGVDKERFMKHIEKKPATYADWSRTWDQKTTGKEDALKSPYMEEEFDKARELGVIPQNTESEKVSIAGSWSSISNAGEARNLNLVHMSGVDVTSAEELTEAEMEGRKQAMHALKALKTVVPGFENSKLRNFSMTLGVRDSRKIIGRYNLTEEDVKNEARFHDSIGIFPEFIDGYSILILPTTGRYFQVPYGCLVPEKIDNLLVGGRCCAGDNASHAAMRNMMACTVSGQGCGVAAAVTVKTGKTTQTVDVKAIQGELKRQGVRID
jgi:ribulose 1,5-bisphosphate synthetase/thiazole synthase|eukprot:g1285.t1